MASPNRQKKEELIDKIVKKLADAKSVVLADYRGLNVPQISQLRHKIGEKSAELQVIKNTLLKLALKKANYPEPEKETLQGPTVVLFSHADEVAALKELDTFAQTHELPKIKAGYLRLQLLAADSISQLARLPGREMLLGQITNTIAAPLFGLASVLQTNMRNLIFALDQIKSQKSNN